MVGHAVAFSPDYQKGKIAAVNIFKLLDRQPKILVDSTTGEKPKECHGNIEYKSVYFNYPTRPNAKILNGLNLKIIKGQTIALVGSSGCGKSTCVQLLERFYDCNDGDIVIMNIFFNKNFYNFFNLVFRWTQFS